MLLRAECVSVRVILLFFTSLVDDVNGHDVILIHGLLLRFLGTIKVIAIIFSEVHHHFTISVLEGALSGYH